MTSESTTVSLDEIQFVRKEQFHVTLALGSPKGAGSLGFRLQGKRV